MIVADLDFFLFILLILIVIVYSIQNYVIKFVSDF
jgi:hypothetical protein